LERQFKSFPGMSPKYYQQIQRVKQALEDIKNRPDTDLVELALEHEFSDQAHMTREFKRIARITPNQYRRLIK